MFKNALSTFIKGGILQKPGDELSARVTKNHRQILKYKTDSGNTKYSATLYPNGTIVETKTTKNN